MHYTESIYCLVVSDEQKDGDFMYLNEHFLRGVLPEVMILSEAFPEDAHFSVDSRTLQPGDIFVAIQGEKSDGHSFLHQALTSGAAGLIIDISKKDLLNNLMQSTQEEAYSCSY